ncbi:hypothetical protein QR680_000826 [Steinernema hermaphroditum]|uniref:Uncharacterized protein n=1 Tax=Steinernema hermaphroditum TaxID=289476 RepID=A0AA39LEV5_9BILA|nr:hypothetical protein QR680_000826 [Steinernema hermaphroditum]
MNSHQEAHLLSISVEIKARLPASNSATFDVRELVSGYGTSLLDMVIDATRKAWPRIHGRHVTFRLPECEPADSVREPVAADLKQAETRSGGVLSEPVETSPQPAVAVFRKSFSGLMDRVRRSALEVIIEEQELETIVETTEESNEDGQEQGRDETNESGSGQATAEATPGVNNRLGPPDDSSNPGSSLTEGEAEKCVQQQQEKRADPPQ